MILLERSHWIALVFVVPLIITAATGSVVAQPPNDECGGAIDITGLPLVVVNTTSATPPGTTPDDSLCEGTFLGEQFNDVWYSWIAPANGRLTLTTCDAAGFDTSISMYEGTCAALSDYACNGDATPDAACQEFHSVIEDQQVISGTAYLIQVGGFDALSSGIVTMELTFEEGALVPIIAVCEIVTATPGTVIDLLVNFPEPVDMAQIFFDGELQVIQGAFPGGPADFSLAIAEPLAPGEHTVAVTATVGGNTSTALCTVFNNACSCSTTCIGPTGPQLIPVVAVAPVVPVGCASCNDTITNFHDNNSYYRVFDLFGLGIGNPIQLDCFSVEISEATTPSFAGQPVRIRVHVDNTGGAPDLASLTTLYEEEFLIRDLVNETLHLVPGTGNVDPDGMGFGDNSLPTLTAGTTLVLEFFTPDGQADGNTIFLGRFENFSEDPLSVGGSYLRAPDCGITAITPTASVAPDDRYWISVAYTPLSDCDGNGLSDTQQIAADPTLDCDGNGQIDSCEIAALPFLDVNNNGILDSCLNEPDAIFIGQGSWNEPFNWAKQVVPAPTENVLVRGIAVIDAMIEAAALDIDGGVLEFNIGGTIAVDSLDMGDSLGVSATPNAYLTVQFSGTESGALIEVTGEAILAGQLRYESKGGALPCDVNSLISAGSIVGTLDSIKAGLPEPFLEIRYFETAVELHWRNPPVPCEFDKLSELSGGGDVAIDGTVAVVSGASGVFVHRWDGTTWVEEQQLTVAGAGAAEEYGYDIDIDGDVIVVGAPLSNVITVPPFGFELALGGASVFRYQDPSWVLEESITNPTQDSRFGESVSVSGDTIIVTSQGFDTVLTWPYRFDGANWSLVVVNVGDEAIATAAVAGDFLFVGFDQFGGSPYVRAYDWNGSGWTVVMEEFLPGAGTGLAPAVAMTEQYAVVAAPGSDVRVYERVDNTWINFVTIPPVPGATNFGSSVALFDDTLVVGAESASDCVGGTGSAYVYHANGDGNWNTIPYATLCPDDLGSDTNFGRSVAVSDNFALIGQGTFSSGSTYTFGLSGDEDCDDISDICAIQSGLESDCNANLVIDSIDIAEGVLDDDDGNGIPDICDTAFFVRGDPTGDNMVGLTDVLVVLNYLFLSGSLTCEDAADATDDGMIGLTDALYTLNYLFTGGRPIPPPVTCGSDPTSDDPLSCETPCSDLRD